MVTLFEKDLVDTGRRSSKGNQLKWRCDGIWYKADYTGYEALSEYIISRLLMKSTLTPDEFVLYELEDIAYKSSVFHGAKSPDLLHDDWQIITLERLFKTVYGKSLNELIYKTDDHTDRLKLIVEQTERITKLKGFDVYMAKLLTIDALFLNEDRHTHNIAILVNGDGDYKLCPFFDQGAGLLSDTTMDYPLDADVFSLTEQVRAKTFCTDFEEQVEIAEKLYGQQITFSFGKKDVDKLLSKVDRNMYNGQIIERVRTILYQQMRKYGYLFK